MKYTILFFSMLIMITSFAQKNNPLTLGKVDSVYSKTLNEKREIFVYDPRMEDNAAIFQDQLFPVIYLFDGEAHFLSVAAMVRQLSATGVLPEMIVVGITNTNRTRDLTPTHVDTATYFDKVCGWDTESMKTSGGGENFAAFMEKELFPHIDSLYHTAPYRLLIGHSFGGLSVINILFKHQDLFKSYIAIDPTFFWDNFKILKQSETNLAKGKFEGKNLFLAIANLRQPKMDVTFPLEKDTAVFAMNMRFNFQFKEALNKNKQNMLRWSSTYYKDDNHGSVPFIAEYDGLRFIFSFYKMHISYGNALITFNADSAFTAHYKNITKQMGYPVAPSMTKVSDVAYYYLKKKMFEKAFSLFKMNADNYPKSWFVYDDLGNYYNAKGEKQKAIDYFTKALTFFEYPDTRAKLEKLKAGK